MAAWELIRRMPKLQQIEIAGSSTTWVVSVAPAICMARRRCFGPRAHSCDRRAMSPGAILQGSQEFGNSKLLGGPRRHQPNDLALLVEFLPNVKAVVLL